jgi:hypothetical protein
MAQKHFDGYNNNSGSVNFGIYRIWQPIGGKQMWEYSISQCFGDIEAFIRDNETRTGRYNHHPAGWFVNVERALYGKASIVVAELNGTEQNKRSDLSKAPFDSEHRITIDDILRIYHNITRRRAH